MSAATNLREAATALAEAAPEVRKPSNVIQALAAIAGELPAIGKDGKADPKHTRTGGSSRSPARRNGCSHVPRVVHHDIRPITVNDKPWTDTIELVEYDVYGPGGPEDRITVGPILAVGRDNSDKGANKCMTQAFKYALLQTLCISDAKDDSDGQTHEADAPAFVWNATAVKVRLLELLGGNKTAAAEAWRLGHGDDLTEFSPAVADRLAEEWRANQPAGPVVEPPKDTTRRDLLAKMWRTERRHRLAYSISPAPITVTRRLGSGGSSSLTGTRCLRRTSCGSPRSRCPIARARGWA